MRLALLAHPQPAALIAALTAGACPPRDRTSRTDKALTTCRHAWEDAYAQANAKGLTAAKALRMAQVAYKLAMPKMDSLATIRAAISCTAQGIQLEVFDGRDGSQLLYAAQVALATLKVKGAKKP
jgi:hypothetical protein